jgi:hypothetical protein
MSAPPDSVIQAAAAGQGVVKKNAMSETAIKVPGAAGEDRMVMIV